MAKMSATYRCNSHLVNKEVGEPGSFADESLLTEREAIGATRLLIRL